MLSAAQDMEVFEGSEVPETDMEAVPEEHAATDCGVSRSERAGGRRRPGARGAGGKGRAGMRAGPQSGKRGGGMGHRLPPAHTPPLPQGPQPQMDWSSGQCARCVSWTSGFDSRVRRRRDGVMTNAGKLQGSPAQPRGRWPLAKWFRGACARPRPSLALPLAALPPIPVCCADVEDEVGTPPLTPHSPASAPASVVSSLEGVQSASIDSVALEAELREVRVQILQRSVRCYLAKCQVCHTRRGGGGRRGWSRSTKGVHCHGPLRRGCV